MSGNQADVVTRVGASLQTSRTHLISFISIPTLFLYDALKNHPDYIISSDAATGVLWGGFLEVIVALAGIGTAVTLFPVVKRAERRHGALLCRNTHP